MKIDIKKRGLPGFFMNEMAFPDLVVERFH
jgi:hypothetical protein